MEAIATEKQIALREDSFNALFELTNAGVVNITPDTLDYMEAALFDMVEKGTPGVFELDIPVTHTFTDHTYIREGVMPKGSLIIGHFHREAHWCIILKGSFALLNSDRTLTEIKAPTCFYAGPGRKVGYMREDVVMQNIHPTEGWPKELLDDVEKMEEHIYKRSQAYLNHRSKRQQTGELARLASSLI